MEKRIQFRRWERSDLETQFWLRTFAFTIDVIITRMMILPIVITCLGYFVNIFQEYPQDLTDDFVLSTFRWNAMVVTTLYATVFVLYASVMESSRLRGTIGKWFLRYKVCDVKFNKISFSKALLRNVLKLVSILSLIGVAIIDVTPKRQALHDLVAGTILTRR